jgi:predicted DNA-binding ribbon-helix-helix protein
VQAVNCGPEQSLDRPSGKNSLKEIGGERHMTLSHLVAAIDSQRQYGNLSSAIRLFVLDFYRVQLSDAEEGTIKRRRRRHRRRAPILNSLCWWVKQA